jgi:catechol 2,3-dioxygenase-like lactoylglutathione lyase family enzyme
VVGGDQDVTTKRTEAQKWSVSGADYGRSLTGLTLNLLVRDVARSLPFYTEVLGFRDLHHDPDFAALERDGTKLTLHADHTYGAQPWAPRLAESGKRGLGAEIRILGVDPEEAERRARERGYTVLVGTKEWPHGWRDCVLEDPDGYTFAVGVPL